MNEVIQETSSTIREKVVVKSIKLDGDLHVYRLAKSYHVDAVQGFYRPNERSNVVSEGFVTTENLRKMQKGEEFTDEHLYIVPPDLIEAYRTNGLRHLIFHCGLQEGQSSPYDQAASGSFSAADLFRIDRSDDTIWNRQGEIMASAIFWNYIDGRSNDLHYDLGKLIEHLASRDDITFLKEGCADHEVARPADAVSAIPYYNRHCGHNQVMFLWAPDDATYRRIYDHAKTRYPAHPVGHLHEAVFELDALGLRAAGAAKYQTPHESDPEPRHIEDD